MTNFWGILLAVLLGLLIIALLVLFVAVALYALNRAFDELMKH